MSNHWGNAATATLHTPGDELPGDEEAFEDGQYGVAADGGGDDLVVICGSEAEMAELGRRLVRAFAAPPTRPAVTFDPDGFRVWLDEANEPGVEGSATNRDVSPLLSAAYQRGDGEAGWVAETTLDMLHSSAPHPHPSVPAAWRYGEGVRAVRVWATAAEDGGAGGGLTGEVVVDGVTLSLGRLTGDELVAPVYDMLPGYEAAEHALSAVADRVNEVAAQFRKVRRPAGLTGQLTDTEIEQALVTLAGISGGGDHAEDLTDSQKALMTRLRTLLTQGMSGDA